ncbi:MAG: DeoR/GlpR family DNA-binding transcription regulator [Opitutales bacterium]|nr:DeoR/GlpR family DNA-binding transcription regulator [Opitutales bacterium]
MQSEQRKKQIQAILSEREFVSLEALAREIGASPSTIRRDLIDLENTGLLQRTHGGARTVARETQDEFAFRNRLQRFEKEKAAIGQAAATLVETQQCVICDTGTTVYEAARRLESKMPQILTNSLPVANLYASSAGVELIVSGGVLYPRLGALVGPVAEKFFGQFNANLAIMGGDGVTADGIYNSHTLLIDIQRKMMDAAERVIFCLDSGKVGRRSVSRLCDLDRVDLLITDRKASPEILDSLRQRGLEVETV